MADTAEMMNERQEKQQRITELQWDLTSFTSDIGDYKVIKCLTAAALGKEMPYDLAAIEKKRQEVRDEINKLQAELDE